MGSVMVIEDEPEVLSVLVDLIRERGHEAIGVARTSEALELVGHLRPDVIVLDLVMPPRELDGIEFLFRLRRKRRTLNIPVLVVSGLANVINPRAAQYLGVRALHTKPFETAQLLDEIDSALNRT